VGLAIRSAFAYEFVAFESGGHLETLLIFDAIGTENLAHATQVNGLRSVVIQGDDVFDGSAQIGFASRGEEDSAGTDVLGTSNKRNAFGAGASD